MRLAAILSVIALLAACGGSDPGASNDYEVAALDVAGDDAGAPDAYAKCTLVIVPYGNCVHRCAQMFQHARDDFRYCKWKCGQECQ